MFIFLQTSGNNENTRFFFFGLKWRKAKSVKYIEAVAVPIEDTSGGDSFRSNHSATIFPGPMLLEPLFKVIAKLAGFGPQSRQRPLPAVLALGPEQPQNGPRLLKIKAKLAGLGPRASRRSESRFGPQAEGASE